MRSLSVLAEPTLLGLVLTRLAFAPPAPRTVHGEIRPSNARPADGSALTGIAEYAEDLARRIGTGLSPIAVLRSSPPTCGADHRSALGEWWAAVDHSLASGATLDRSVRLAPSRGDLDVLSVALISARGDTAALVEGLRRAATVVRSRDDLRRRRRASIAQAVLSARVMTALPPVILLGASLLSPGVRAGISQASMLTVIGLGIGLDLLGWRWMRSIAGRAPGERRDVSDSGAGIEREEGLTLLVDLMAIGVRSGSTAVETIAVLAEVGPSSLRAPLSAVADAVNRGVRLELALARLGEDRNADRLASILSDCARDGSPLAPALEHLAGDLRSETRRRHHTAIGELPVRLTPPLVLCTLPAVVLIAVAPITITALRAVRAGL